MTRTLKHPAHFVERVVARIEQRFLKHWTVNRNDLELETLHYSPTKFDDSAIASELAKLGRFDFLPNHGNMGDILIARSEYQLFDRHGLQYDVFHRKITNDELVYGGGGIFVREWKAGYQKILELFKSKRLKKILILPSSFDDCPDLCEILDSRFTIFCRENKSYEYISSRKTGATILLDNDVAFFLEKDFMEERHRVLPHYRYALGRVTTGLETITERNGYKIAFFLRTDGESNAKENPIIDASTFDLSACVYSDSRDRDECGHYTKLFLASIDVADIVVTDRLHVGIGSMLMGKTVFLLDNSYGKISGVYEKSMSGFPRIHFVADSCVLDEMIDAAIFEGSAVRSGGRENLKKIGRTAQ